MNENINLCNILKGHEGETFYCSLVGQEVILLFVNKDSISVDYVNKEIFEEECKSSLELYSNGAKFNGGECVLFPSKYKRDWNKWIEEQNLKASKTWSKLYNSDNCTIYNLSKIDKVGCVIEITGTPIEKSALALLKAHQLIEVGYGGNVRARNKVNFYTIQWSYEFNRFVIKNFGPFLEDSGTHFCFHTKEQAIEFLKYPENVQLLKDYFMI